MIDEVLSWRLVAELLRRAPERFFLLETHPGGGMYDCLTLWPRTSDSRVRLDVNRGGGVHVAGDIGVPIRSWTDWSTRLIDGRGRELLDELATALEIPVSDRLPATTPYTVILRFIAEFLTHAVGRLESWECRNGFCDSAGPIHGPRDEWFKLFPQLANRHPLRRIADLPFSAEYYHWFLVRDREPLLCLRSDGLVADRTGRGIECWAEYQRSRRIWPVIQLAAGHLLP